jgi:riboflavin kinase/FMN adenylyltransferase
MKTSRTFASLCRSRRPIVLAAGFFDGLHRGHRAVLRRAVAMARAIDGAAWVLTFDRHPLALLNPAVAPPAISSRRATLDGFRRLGFDGCLMLPFTRALARLAPKGFVDRLTACRPALARVVVGSNWKFGRGGAGTPEVLAVMGRKVGFGVTVVSPVLHAGRPVSSTRLRAAIMNGRMEKASALLGRPFLLHGRVVRGRGVGRRLGFPTANLRWEDAADVRPPDGAYAVRARNGRRVFDGMLNLGKRPTFPAPASKKSVAELHLFGFAGSLYGCRVEVAFGPRLRSERRFPSACALQRQLRRDEKSARAALSRTARSKSFKEWLYTDGALAI